MKQQFNPQNAKVRFGSTVEYDYNYSENKMLKVIIWIALVVILVGIALYITTPAHAQACDTCDPGAYMSLHAPDSTEKPAKERSHDVPSTSTNNTNETVTIAPEPVQDTSVDDTLVVVDNPPVQIGNPGNNKPVGKAGEKCDKGMCENGNNGEKGNSDNPNKGNGKNKNK